MSGETPPRKVPVTLALRVLALGIPGQAGCIFLALGAFLAAPIGVAVVQRALLLDGVETEGEVVKTWEEVEHRQEGTESWDVVFVHHRYAYWDADGGRHEGTGFHQGDTLPPGTIVNVRYVAISPRIHVTREFGGVPAVTGLFFLLVLWGPGLALAIHGRRKRRALLGLLRRGVLARPALDGVEETSTILNGERVHRVTYSLGHPDGHGGTPWRASLETTQTTGHQEGTEDVHVLYDPDDPTCAELLHSGRPWLRLGPDGHWHPASLGSVAVRYLLPALVVVALVASVWLTAF